MRHPVSMYMQVLVKRVLGAYRRKHGGASARDRKIRQDIDLLLRNQERIRVWFFDTKQPCTAWSTDARQVPGGTDGLSLPQCKPANPGENGGEISLFVWLVRVLDEVQSPDPQTFPLPLDRFVASFFRSQLHEDLGEYVDALGRSIAPGAQVFFADGLHIITACEAEGLLLKNGTHLSYDEMARAGLKLSDHPNDALDSLKPKILLDVGYRRSVYELLREQRNAVERQQNEELHRAAAELAAAKAAERKVVPHDPGLNELVSARINLMRAKRVAINNITVGGLKRSKFASFKA